MRNAYIIDAVRTPIAHGKPTGAYHDVHPVDLHAHALRALRNRAGVDPSAIDDVISGVVGQIGEQSGNAARWAALASGLPESVPAVTVDRQCGSSQQAIHFAAQGVLADAYDMVIASGVESMSRVPMGSQVNGQDFTGPTVDERYADRKGLVPQGISAELIAQRWGFDRDDLEEFALTSHARAAAAWRDGHFASQVAPLTDPDGRAVLAVDETIRPGSTPAQRARLRPSFESEHWRERYPELQFKVTAATSSPINDGSAAVLIAGDRAVARRGLTPRARLHAFALAGDDPIMMLTGVIPATQKVLDRAGMSIDDIDLFEVNEAFASVVLAWQQELGVDPERVNVNGGAIAIGHPLGASGARLATTLLSALEQTGGRFGLQTMCEAGGLANAMIVERL